MTAAVHAGEGTAPLRVVLGHLAEWTRAQFAAVQATAGLARSHAPAAAPPDAGAAGGAEPVVPEALDGPPAYLAREGMIQDAMALRSFGELARAVDDVLMAAAHWVADCDDALWRRPLPGPARGPGEAGRERFLADLLAGWGGPLAHVEWHLDQLDAAALGPLASADPAGRQDDEGLLVMRCPLRTS